MMNFSRHRFGKNVKLIDINECKMTFQFEFKGIVYKEILPTAFERFEDGKFIYKNNVVYTN